ncbi:uncharacterized protein LOC116124855 [Pistacia vera]|uniref:uncharacterized protein LOC116124855 n=1 Tax=Pistacia vera TaxID=55513 RepID=UPI001262D915|nr:uncharacterized protein LOC116124855 [Pistacia vera]
MAIMKGMGPTVKWSAKLNPKAKRDMTKWCKFYGDHGHNTADYIALRLEVAALQKMGHLRDPLTDKGKNTVIQFEDNKPVTLAASHHDALVISFQIANILVKRVFVDGGSSAKIIFLEAVKATRLDETNINRQPTILVGFSFKQKYTIGEIALPVYTSGVNKETIFLVLDCPSPYDIILGRPWIYDMRAVPSTLHQTIRFSTKWGVREIKGNPKAFRDCYKNAFKSKGHAS